MDVDMQQSNLSIEVDDPEPDSTRSYNPEPQSELDSIAVPSSTQNPQLDAPSAADTSNRQELNTNYNIYSKNMEDDEDEKMTPDSTINKHIRETPTPTDTGNTLVALADVALDQSKEFEKNKEINNIGNLKNVWYTVDFVRGTQFVMREYFYIEDDANLNCDAFPDVSRMRRYKVAPGTAKKFRVAGINSVGRGNWSDVKVFKTCLPGFPGAQCSIKINKTAEGANISWDSPNTVKGETLEYSAYLAIQSTKDKDKPKDASQLAFVRVYCEIANYCLVPAASLAAAHLDMTTKPAIIFRIAAKNDRGYGPASYSS